jgi:hypothetical protein
MPGEPPLRAGMTAAVSVDTKRERKLASLLEIFTTARASRDRAPDESRANDKPAEAKRMVEQGEAVSAAAN